MLGSHWLWGPFARIAQDLCFLSTGLSFTCDHTSCLIPILSSPRAGASAAGPEGRRGRGQEEKPPLPGHLHHHRGTVLGPLWSWEHQTVYAPVHEVKRKDSFILIPKALMGKCLFYVSLQDLSERRGRSPKRSLSLPDPVTICPKF